MNKIQTCIALATVVLGLNFSSCSDNEDGIDWNGVEVTNTELKTLLQAKGFTFNEAGKLVQDDKVKNATTLDLSSSNLSDISGLETLFPNLTDINLSDNKFKNVFDFSKLPATVTSVDLTGNEIYEYPGLVNIETAENGDETVTVQRKLTKLLLPEGAKYNCVEIPTFFANSKETDMQMVNASGALETYNTLREVPDENVRALLKKNFSALFEGDYIDITKRLIKAEDQSLALTVYGTDYKNVEGVQYIIHNKSYKGGTISIHSEEYTTIPYLKINSSTSFITMEHINTPNGIDFSNATNLCRVYMYNNNDIVTLNISASTSFGQRDILLDLSATSATSIALESCLNMRQIIFPKAAKNLYLLSLIDLPKLENLDLTQFATIGNMGFQLSKINCSIKYPIIENFIKGGEINNEAGYTYFTISEDIYNKSETKEFITSYKSHLKRNNRISPRSKYIEKTTSFDWTNK